MFSSATTDVTGLIITVTGNQSFSVGSGGLPQLFVDGLPAALSFKDKPSGTTVRYDVLSNAAYGLATLTLSATQGTWLANGVPSAAIAGQSVTNASTKTAVSSLTTLGFWLRGDGVFWQNSNLTTSAVTDGDLVGAAVDQSPAGRNVIQATAGNRPTLKTAILNSKPVLRFNGAVSLTNSGGLFQGDFTVFIVARTTAINADRAVCGWGVRSAQQTRQFHQRSAGNRALVGNSADVDATSAWSNNVWTVWTVTAQNVPTGGATTVLISHRVNGVDVSPATKTATWTVSASNTLSVGCNTAAGEFWTGDIAEIAACSGVLDQRLIVACEAEINTRWGTIY